jgi:hypothetical protein
MQSREERNKVFLGVPNTGNLRVELVEWIFKQGLKHVYLPNIRPVDTNRNHIVDTFLQTDCEWLLMVDSDLVPPNDVLEMINNDVDICSAWICINKGQEIIPLAMKEVEGGYQAYATLKQGINKVDATGTGCLLLKRKVFDKVERPFFQFKYNKAGYLVAGEDFNFCKKASEYFDIHFDTRFRCKHYVTHAI